MVNLPDVIDLTDEAATLDMGKKLAASARAPLLIFLEGDVGAGKTTFVRGFLQGLHYTGIVKSPTYTIVETYQLPLVTLYHFDLYRLSHPEELEFMGIRDYFAAPAITLIEWPIKGEGFLPKPDLLLHLADLGEGRRLTLQYLTAPAMVCKQGLN